MSSNRGGIVAGVGSLVVLLAGAVFALVKAEFGPDQVEKLADPEPLIVREGIDKDRDGWALATAQPVNEGSAPPAGSTCEDARRWVEREGGVSYGETWLTIRLEGRRTGNVEVTSMRARSLDRGEPVSGSVVQCSNAGETGNADLGFDLDSSSLAARSLTADGELGAPYFPDNTFTLKKEQSVTLSVVGRASSAYHRWVIDLRYAVDGKEETVRIGSPAYRTTALAPAYSTKWNWAWYREPEDLEPIDSESDPASDEAEPAAAATECTSQEISSSDRDALSAAVQADQPALPNSVYFGVCGEESWAIARFEGPPGDGVFHQSGGTWTTLGTLQDSSCDIPAALLEAWSLTC